MSVAPEFLDRISAWCPPGTDPASIAFALDAADVEPVREPAGARALVERAGLPPLFIPLGARRSDGAVVAAALIPAEVERHRVPIVAQAGGGAWVPLAGSPDDDPGCAAYWLARARRGGEVRDPRVLAEALRRPPSTAPSLAAFEGLCDELAAAPGVDAQLRRLARAGADPEKWRQVGAERAVAGRVREAWHALQGAVVLAAWTGRRIDERLVVRALRGVMASSANRWAVAALDALWSPEKAP